MDLLHIASRDGQVEAVRELIKLGADIEARDTDDYTPLHIASQSGQVEAIRELIKLGADIEARGSIHDETPLHLASVEAIRELIKLGADIEARLSFHGYTPLHLVSLGGQVEAVRELIKLGADIEAKDRDRFTPLHRASHAGRVEAVRELIKLGADIEARDIAGESPLHRASQYGSVETVRELIKLEADIEAKDRDGYTPLHLASQSGQVEAVRELIKLGADIEAKDTRGYTPLHVADVYREVSGRGMAIRELLKLGASAKGWNLDEEDLIHLVGMDMIMFEEKHVDEYLGEDPMNFVILDKNNPIFTNVTDLQNNMEDAIVLECKTVGNYAHTNVVHDRELFNPRKIGTASGYFDATSLRDAMGLVAQEKTRLFRLSGSVKTIPAVVSQLAFENRTDLLGANHCQAGADGDIRVVEPVYVSYLPSATSVGDVELEKEASMLANSYLIAKNSSVETGYAQKLRETINEASTDLFENPLLERFVKNINSGILSVRSSENMTYLANMCRTFQPNIGAVEVHARDVLDFSFLHDMRGLKRFSSVVSLNTRSVFSHLKKHRETLQILSVPIEAAIGDLSEYTSLQKVRLFNFDNYEGVIEAVSRLRRVQHLDLESSDFYGNLTGLGEIQGLKKLTLTLSRFTGDITPVSKLTSLETLELHLPLFNGPVAPLKNLRNLRKLKMTSRAGIDVDIVSAV